MLDSCFGDGMRDIADECPLDVDKLAARLVVTTDQYE